MSDSFQVNRIWITTSAQNTAVGNSSAICHNFHNVYCTSRFLKTYKLFEAHKYDLYLSVCAVQIQKMPTSPYFGGPPYMFVLWWIPCQVISSDLPSEVCAKANTCRLSNALWSKSTMLDPSDVNGKKAVCETPLYFLPESYMQQYRFTVKLSSTD